MIEMTLEEAQSVVNSAIDSVTVINNVVSGIGSYTQDRGDMVKRNVDHLNTIMQYPKVIELDSPQIPVFEDAVDLGNQYLLDNNYQPTVYI